MSFSDAIRIGNEESMSTLNELEPGSPEYEAEIDRLQALEDAERDGSAAGTGEDEDPDHDGAAEANPASEAGTGGGEQVADAGAGANAGDAGAGEGAASAAAEPAPAETPAKVAGVSSKDGKNVLPYSVVQAERRKSARLRDALEDANRQIEHLKSKAAAPAASDVDDDGEQGINDDELTDLEQDFPQLAKVVKELRDTRAEILQLKTSAPTQGKSDAPAPGAGDARAESEESEDPTLDAIDQIPVLAGWMSNPADADKFERAQDIDRALEKSPKWRGKPLVDRFKHVTKLVAEEFDLDIQINQEDSAPSQTQTNTPPARRDPEAAIRAARETTPNTLSDFKGGAPTETGDPIKRLSAPAQVNRLLDMSDAEIDAWLAKGG